MLTTIRQNLKPIPMLFGSNNYATNRIAIFNGKYFIIRLIIGDDKLSDELIDPLFGTVAIIRCE